jgi:hypothetical protein
VYPTLVAWQWLSKYPLIIAKQWLGENVTAAMNTNTTTEELLAGLFSRKSLSYHGK